MNVSIMNKEEGEQLFWLEGYPGSSSVPGRMGSDSENSGCAC